jgi:hypothetical protein
MSLDDPAPGDPNTFVLGTFVATYPAARYTGTAGAFVAADQWSVSLIPSTSRPCSVPQTTTHGSTVLSLTVAGDRMAGEATLLECEGVTTWSAAFARR